MPARLWRADGLLVVSSLSFGSLAIFGRLAYGQGMNVQSLLAARFLVGGVILLLLALATRATIPRGATLLGLVLMGAAGYVGQSAAYFNSIRYVPVAVTAVMLYTYPAIVLLLSWPLYGIRPTRWRALALVLAMAGVFLVASPRGGLRWEGVVLGLCSAAVYSVYILSGKRVMAGAHPLSAAAIVALSAGVTYLLIAMLSRTFVAPPSTTAWLAVAGLALIATVVGAGAFLAGLRLTDPARAALISTLEPASAAVLAALFLGELLSPTQLLGGALVLVTIVISARY